MPTSDEPRAAPSPGAYAGHQMIELERLGACPAECRGRIVRLQATWRPSFAFGGRPFLRPSLRPQVVLAPSSPRRTMAAMVDLLLRRAPAASGEVYDVLRGCPAVTQRSPRVRFTTGPIPILTRSTSLGRRLCNPLGRSLGCAAHCFAISVARARAALTATFPPLDPLPSLTCDRRRSKKLFRARTDRAARRTG